MRQRSNVLHDPPDSERQFISVMRLQSLNRTRLCFVFINYKLYTITI